MLTYVLELALQVCYQYPWAHGCRGLYDRLPEWSHSTPENAGPQLAQKMLSDDWQEVIIFIYNIHI